MTAYEELFERAVGEAESAADRTEKALARFQERVRLAIAEDGPLETDHNANGDCVLTSRAIDRLAEITAGAAEELILKIEALEDCNA